MSLAGKNIGRYRIIEQLGQGGMAVVYKAFDTRLQRDVALKLIRTENIPPAQLEQLQKRFEREALTQSRFHHPNIVPIHDFGEHEGSPYLIMTYLPGGTLQALTGTPMPYPQAAELLAPIADALAYAHEKDVLHRDIKPSNILLGEKGQPTLTDFGIAKLLGDVDAGTLTGTGMGIGTPQYMAPEQWQGKSEKATDIYALGVVFYELITGRKPYDAETPAALILIQANDPLPRPSGYIPDLPEHVEQALYTALAPQPEDRYESMAAFEAVLKSLSREEAQPAETPLAQTMVEELPVFATQVEELAEPEVEESESAEPIMPTFYPKYDKTESEIPPPEPPTPAAQFEDRVKFQPAPKQKSKMPVWSWGLIGLVILVGIIFGVTQLGGGEKPVAEVAKTSDFSLEKYASSRFVVVEPGEPVRIGASVALTGPIPEFGQDISQSYQLAVSDLNVEGGIAGHQIEIDIQDGACDGDAATVIANGFAADPSILAVAGGTCTGETLGLQPILEAARIPFVTATASNPAITSEDCTVCNRVAMNDKLQADVSAEYIFNSLGLTYMAILHDNTAYGLSLATNVQDAFEKLGGTVTSFDAIQYGDTDFRPVLTEVATGTPEVIYFGGYYQEAALIANQMAVTGLEDVVFFSDDGVYSAAFIESAGDPSEGMFVTMVAGDEDVLANQQFDAKYERMWGVSPDDLGPFHSLAYDSVVMIATALNDAIVDAEDGYLVFDREAVINAVRNTTNLQGLTGIITCDEIGNCGAGGIQIFQVQNGVFVQVAGFGIDEN